MDIDTPQNLFQIILNPVQNNNTGRYYRTIHPQSIPIPIHVFVIYLNKLIENNKNLEHPLYRPSHLESLQKSDYFALQDIEMNIKRQNNPHYWLQQ